MRRHDNHTCIHAHSFILAYVHNTVNVGSCADGLAELFTLDVSKQRSHSPQNTHKLSHVHTYTL